MQSLPRMADCREKGKNILKSSLVICSCMVIVAFFCNHDKKSEFVATTQKTDFGAGTTTAFCNRKNDSRTTVLTLNNRCFVIARDSEKTSVSLCAGGIEKILIDTLEPLSTDERPSYTLGRIRNDSCLLLYTYSGGAGCCYGVAVFRSTEPYFMGLMPTYQSIAEIKDVDRDGLNELIVRDYGEFPGLSGDDPVPPQVAYTISDGVLAADKGGVLNQFYLAEAQNYRSDIDSLLKGDCSRYNRLSLQMYIVSVKNSGDTGSIRQADSLAARVKCKSGAVQDEDE